MAACLQLHMLHAAPLVHGLFHSAVGGVGAAGWHTCSVPSGLLPQVLPLHALDVDRDRAASLDHAAADTCRR